ncbi:hypothetical protein C0J52_12170 [Blattella germanica]|nr:hypothetical protein C0J52_12170 [Blattella germanica]
MGLQSSKTYSEQDSFLSKLRNTKYADVEEVLSAFGIFELDNNLPLRDLDIEEEITEEEEKIIAEYEALLADEENMYTDLLQKSIEEVVCPVCEKTALVMEQIAPCTSQIVCHRCNISISGKSSLKDFGIYIQSCVSSHTRGCGEKPQFCAVAEDNSTQIYLLCSHCSYMNII